MDPSYRKIRIELLRGEVELRGLTCESFARKFERQQLTGEQRSELLNLWEDLLKESHLLQVMLDVLEKEEMEAALGGAYGSTLLDSQRFAGFTGSYQAKDKTSMA